jgi:hypothetical protein
VESVWAVDVEEVVMHEEPDAAAGERNGIILLFVAVAGLTAPLVEARWAVAVVGVAIGAIVLRAGTESNLSRPAEMILRSLVGLVLLATTLGVFSGPPRVKALVFLAFGLLLASAPILVLRNIMNHRIVTAQTILGAVSVYALIGLVFAFLFSAFSGLGVASVAGPEEVEPGSFVYFSFVTLTTLGFGDIAPLGYVARTLTVFESLLGQIFLVTFIGRLVGNMSTRT